MSAHTPGPWFVSNGTFEQAHVCGHEDVMIAVVSKQDPQCDGGRCTVTERANAQLIAAAPELFRISKLLLERYEFRHQWSVADEREVFILLNGAIAKVEGRA